MQPSDELIKRLIELPSPELLRRIARELYQIEPLRHGGKYVDGETVAAWDSSLLSDDAQKRCMLYPRQSSCRGRRPCSNRQVVEAGTGRKLVASLGKE